MRNFLSILALTAVMLLVMSPANANGENNGNGCRNRCGDTTNNVDRSVTNNKGGKGGTGVGIGVGISKSNSSSSSRSSSESSSRSSAYQSQGQGQIGINKQSGVVKNVGPQVVISETYEAAANVAGATGSAWDCGDVVGLSGSALLGGGSVAIPVNNDTCVDLFVIKNTMHFGNMASKGRAQSFLGDILDRRVEGYAARTGGFGGIRVYTPDN